MKTKLERLTAKRDRLQHLLSQCEEQIRQEQYELDKKKWSSEQPYDETKELVKSPYDMVKVCAVKACVGDAVNEGDTLFVLERMKMEIPILAQKPGKMAQVNAPVGTYVNKGDILAVIDVW